MAKLLFANGFKVQTKLLFIDRERMYELLQTDDGKKIIDVVCGGAAMYSVMLELTEDELANYQSQGKAFLDRLAAKVARNPNQFSDRWMLDEDGKTE